MPPPSMENRVSPFDPPSSTVCPRQVVRMVVSFAPACRDRLMIYNARFNQIIMWLAETGKFRKEPPRRAGLTIQDSGGTVRGLLIRGHQRHMHAERDSASIVHMFLWSICRHSFYYQRKQRHNKQKTPFVCMVIICTHERRTHNRYICSENRGSNGVFHHQEGKEKMAANETTRA